MTLYFLIAPGLGPYAASFEADSEAEARRFYAAFLGRARCPKGTACWVKTGNSWK
jgi:hypothetical protein